MGEKLLIFSIIKKARLALSSVSPQKTILKVHWGLTSARNAKKICFFAHFDPQFRIDPLVVFYMKALKDQGFDIVLVSTSTPLRAEDIQNVRPLVRAVIERKNIGLDFASWSAAMSTIPDWQDYEALLCTNDSLIGPFKDLTPTFSRIEADSALLCGLNDSREIDHHLQSFFLYFKKPLFSRRHFKLFWKNIRACLDKQFIIEQYEVGLSQKFRAAGENIFAAFPFEKVNAAAKALGDNFQYASKIDKTPLNTTLFMWDILLTDFEYPFMKAELFRIDRFSARRIQEWRSIVNVDPTFVEILSNYLKRVGAKIL